MSQIVTALKRASSFTSPGDYSRCPLKKRPIKYEPVEDSDSDESYKGIPSPQSITDYSESEPENLSTKPEDMKLKQESSSSASSTGSLSPPPLSWVAGFGGVRSSQLSPAHAFWEIPARSPPHQPSYRSHYQYPSQHSPDYTRPQGGPQYLLPQFQIQSHFAPISRYGSAKAGSSPHITIEPSYPVIKIEEVLRGSRQPFSHQNLNSHAKFYEETIPHLPQTKRRDSVISHSSVSSSNSQNQHPIVPPPQLSQITPISVNGSVRYECKNCAKSYSTFNGLSKHIQFHCSSHNRKFECKDCGKVYGTRGSLKMHIKSHVLEHCCGICSKKFSRRWLLAGHLRTHTGEKPFECNFCSRKFADRSNLRAHLQTHSEVKKYSCKCCSKTFSRMSLLVKHEDGGCIGADVTSKQISMDFLR